MSKHRVYRHLVNPESYPAYAKRPVKAVTREQIGNKIQFCSTRMFAIDKATKRMTNLRDELDAYTVRNRLGSVVWPFCDTLNCSNLDELVEEVKKRDMYFFDVWGYVPGSWSKTEPWGEYTITPEVRDLLVEGLGSRFLGFDNGEQDGRYVGGYAPMMCPATESKQAHYLNFQRHFEKLSDAMQHNITALCSLHYGHYFVKENDVVLLGAECAQALPNVNLWYAFNRGAGKQYGVLWFGNASVWNRWGYKNYSESGNEGYEWGPEYGTSASLLRRIMYLHYTYNCDILGYELGWLYENKAQPEEAAGFVGQYAQALNGELTPIGVLQADALEFTEEHGYAGVMHTPVAVMLDFFAGYTPPRHLYTSAVYQTWGAMEYDEGDYETHALFNMLYPGYEDAGFFRDERGFVTATPYGDMFDVLLSDAEPEVMASYNRIVLSGRYPMGPEEFDKLRGFAQAGGALHVFLGAVEASLKRFPGREEEFLSFFGLRAMGPRAVLQDGTAVQYGGAAYKEKEFELYEAVLTDGANVRASADDGRPVIWEAPCGAGSVHVVAAPYGINRRPLYDYSDAACGERTGNVENEILPMPYDLLNSVRAYLGDCFNAEKLVDMNPSLCWTVNLLADGKLRVTVANNTSSVQRFDIVPCEGTISESREISIKNVDPDQTGYLPYTYAKGRSEGAGARSIEPLDVRMFVLSVDGLRLEDKPAIAVQDRVQGRYLKFMGTSLRAEIASQPTLDSRFEGLKVDARYFMERDWSVLEYEAGFVKRRATKIIVDFSSLMNHYPDISLLDSIKDRYASNMELIGRTLDKAALYGCTRAVINLHRNAENHVTAEEADECFAKTIASIASQCRERGMELYVQNGTPARHGFLMPRLVRWVDEHRLDVKIAWNPGHSIIGREDLAEVVETYGDRISAILLSVPAKDIHGQFIDAHRPVCGSPFQQAVTAAAGALTRDYKLDFIAFDAGYAGYDEAYLDSKLC